MRFTQLLCIGLLVFSGFSNAQQGGAGSSATSPSDNLRNQTQVYETQRIQTASTATVKAQCMQVTGLEGYCSCLQSKLPVSFTFDNYVVVLSRSKQDNGYSRMDKSAKTIYDAMPQVRDSCAAMLTSK